MADSRYPRRDGSALDGVNGRSMVDQSAPVTEASDRSSSPPLSRFGWAVVFIVVATAARLAAAASIHLTEDEAYYRLWAQHLQLGYFDHPPMIAWWIRIGTVLAGDDPLGVRLLPALSSGLISLLIYDIAALLRQPPQACLRAVIWYNATLIVGLGGMLAIPDLPAALFWALSLWCLAHLYRNRTPWWWLGLGVSAGLAALSKYSALFLAPGVLLWLAFRPGGWRQLSRPWPWAAAVIACAIFSLNIAWNAEHHWVTFAKQFGRVVPGRFEPRHLAEFLFAQFFLLNPFVAIFAGVGVGRAWKLRQSEEGHGDWLLIATALPFVAYLLVHSLHAAVQEHWPAPAYSNVALLAAITAQSKGRGWTWLKRLVPIGIVLSVIGLLHAALPRTGIGLVDPVTPIRGWPRFASQVEALRIKDKAGWVGVIGYGTRAQLIDERVIKAPIIQLGERARYVNNGEVEHGDFTQPGLVVDLSRRVNSADFSHCFQHVGPKQLLNRGAENGPAVLYTAMVVQGPRRDLLEAGCWRNKESD